MKQECDDAQILVHMFYYLSEKYLLCFSLIVSEEPVLRDQFYNGNVKTERGTVNSVTDPFGYLSYNGISIIHCPNHAAGSVFLLLPAGAVVLRLARSWFRIGSLEILAESGEIDLLK